MQAEMQLVTTDQQLSLPASWKGGRCQHVAIQSHFYRGKRNQGQFLLYEARRKHRHRGKRVVCNVYLDCSLHFQVHDLFLLEWAQQESLHGAIQGPYQQLNQAKLAAGQELGCQGNLLCLASLLGSGWEWFGKTG